MPTATFLKSLAPVAVVSIYLLFECLGVGKGNFPSDLSVHSFSESDFFGVKSLMWFHLTKVILIFSPFSSEPKFNITAYVCVGGRVDSGWTG